MHREKGGWTVKALYFGKRGEAGTFTRCGKCRKDIPFQVDDGRFVKTGNEILAVVCEDCYHEVRNAVEIIAPHSFPDLDDQGILCDITQ
jgi:hypothetical protein